MERPTWAPPEVDLDRPSPARIYDYMLGGSHNFAVDREIAEQVLAAAPQLRPAAHANRAFLRRAVGYLVGAGIRQFLDIGSGVPTVGNVHEVAQRLAADTRVVYVDIDPVAVAHSEAIVAGDPYVSVLRADARDPDSILDHPTVTGLLDLDQPVAVLMVGLLHFIPDSADPAALVHRYLDRVPSGSYLVISQVTRPERLRPEQQAASDRYQQTTPVALRTPAEIAAFFTGLDLVEPGLVNSVDWRPEPGNLVEPTDLVPSRVGVARKP